MAKYTVKTIDEHIYSINASTSDVLDGGILVLMNEIEHGEKKMVFAAKDWICVQKVEE